MLRLIVVMLLLFFHFTSYAEHSSSKQIKISSIKNSSFIDRYRKLVLKAYTDLGYSVKMTEISAGREIVEINKGTVDALVIRLSVIEKNNPDLIRVPVILAKGGLFLYCQKRLPCNHSVVDEPLNLIGAIFGQNVTSEYLKGHTASVYKTSTAEQLAEMLSKKRLNYILTVDINGFGNIVGLDESKYNTVKLDSLEAFHYIHKRIEETLPELTVSLKNIIDENSRN